MRLHLKKRIRLVCLLSFTTVFFISLISLVSCSSSVNFAPVDEIDTIDAIPSSHIHYVKDEETIYSIAWRYGLDFKRLVYLNHLKRPYHVVSGQRILLGSSKSNVKEKKFSFPHSKQPQNWLWPTNGYVIHSFSGLNKGIDIAGKMGQPIYATANGLVVYSGNGLRGYGNLIILKHNDTYLSAYAHNKTVYVREGEHVVRGQKIADMGNTGSDEIMLHFEIRQSGRPINPIYFLKNQLDLS